MIDLAKTYMKFIVVISLCFMVMAAYGNDGFYQGAGSTMVPVRNSNLRVIKENLLIVPVKNNKCYALFYKGEVIRDIKTRFQKEIGEYDFAVIGPPCPCSKGIGDSLKPLWRAEAEYEIEAFQDQENVTMGFPIPIWDAPFLDSEGLNEITTPGVVNFKTYINDKKIEKINLSWIQEPDIKADKRKGKYLAYTWQASFKKGAKYRLKTEYDFGVEYAAGFFEGYNYNKGAAPWFLPDKSDHEMRQVQVLAYYLTPLKLWGLPPPGKISIKIVFPANIPITYAVPMCPKPKCVDQQILYYEFNNQFPEDELRISLPWLERWGNGKLEPIQNIDQLEMWQETIGGEKTLISCELARKIENESKDKELKKGLKKMICQSCSR